LEPSDPQSPKPLWFAGERGQHAGRRLPGNLAIGVQVPHGRTGLFEFVQDLGNEGLLALAYLALFFARTRRPLGILEFSISAISFVLLAVSV
jgi:hypothetical protein